MNLTICDEEIKGEFRLYSACKYKYWLKSYESMYLCLFHYIDAPKFVLVQTNICFKKSV